MSAIGYSLLIVIVLFLAPFVLGWQWLSALYKGVHKSFEKYCFLSQCPAMPMGPTDHANIPHALLSAFRKMLKRDGVNIVAVSGRFSAGKSTFLQTFFRRRWYQICPPRVLWVSFARFAGSHGGKPLGGKSLLEALEVSMLQQVFFSFPPDRFPSSRFSRIAPVTLGQSIKVVVFALLTLLSCGVLFKLRHCVCLFDSVLTIVGKEAVGNLWLNYTRIFSYVWLVIAFVFIAVFLYRAYRKGRLLLKYEFKGAQLSLQSPNASSVLNSFLDELIYYLRESKCHYVVFEDIDRFRDVTPFIRLRELNSLVNSSQKFMNRHAPIKFIFSISDELFGDPCERAKFFDYILPIVPYLSSASSLFSFRELLRKGLRTKYLGGRVGSLLRLSSLYIADQRVVVSICNEFFAYRRALSLMEERHIVPLLSLVILKYFEPALFSELYTSNNFITRLNKRKQEMLVKYAEEHREDAVSRKIRSISSIQYLINKGVITQEDVSSACQIRGKGPLHIDNQAFIFSLLEGGYVNESYAGYLTDFKDGGLRLEDRNFEMAVRRGEVVDPKARLNDVRAIISDLPEFYFRSTNIFNQSVFTCLLQNEDGDSSKDAKLRSLCEAMADNSKKALPRFIAYLSRAGIEDGLIAKLKPIIMDVWPSFIEDVSACDNVTNEDKCKIYIKWAVGAVDKKEWLCENIRVVENVARMRHPERFIDEFGIGAESLIDLMVCRNIRFSGLSTILPVPEGLASLIADKDVYEMNDQCVEALCSAYTNEVRRVDKEALKKWINDDAPENLRNSFYRRKTDFLKTLTM